MREVDATGVRSAADVGTVALAVTPAGTGPASTALPSSQLPIDSAVAPPAAASGTYWSVQLGAFAVPANAEALRDRVALLLSSPEAADLPAELRSPRIEVHGGLARVLIGVVADRTVALQWSRVLEKFLARPTALFAR
jgi:cell division septation protein DedD